VTDLEGDPIRDIKHLPICISSNVEGWRVEAWMRRDLRLKYSDIEARTRTTDSSDGRRPIYGSNTLTKRAQLFRQKAALIPWSGRKVDTQGNKDFVDAL